MWFGLCVIIDPLCVMHSGPPQRPARRTLPVKEPRSPACKTRGFTLPVRTGWYGSGVNDPSAGSPTETLLRLLLPLNDKVQQLLRRQVAEA